MREGHEQLQQARSCLRLQNRARGTRNRQRGDWQEAQVQGGLKLTIPASKRRDKE